MKIKATRRNNKVLMEIGRQDERLLSQGDRAASPLRIRRILVPIDFSECSRKALDYALGFARQFQAELFLLHVVTPPFAYGEYGVVDLASVESEMHEAAIGQLNQLSRDQVGETTRCTNRIASGQIMTEIVGLAREENIDLLILSTHGRTGLRHVLLGSVTEQVVRHAPCPVLVVREQEHEFLEPPAAGTRKGSNDPN